VEFLPDSGAARLFALWSARQKFGPVAECRLLMQIALKQEGASFEALIGKQPKDLTHVETWRIRQSRRPPEICHRHSLARAGNDTRAAGAVVQDCYGQLCFARARWK
jgi:hypothetical protein